MSAAHEFNDGVLYLSSISLACFTWFQVFGKSSQLSLPKHNSGKVCYVLKFICKDRERRHAVTCEPFVDVYLQCFEMLLVAQYIFEARGKNISVEF